MKKQLVSALVLCFLASLILPQLAFAKPPSAAKKTTTSTTVTTGASKVALGYYAVDYTGDKDSYNSLVNYGSFFNNMSTFTYLVDSQGNLTGTTPSDGITLAKSKGIRVYALIHNYVSGGFDSNAATTLLASATARQNLINRLKTLLPANGFAGVNVDLENLKATDRANYTQLIKEIKAALGPLGYTVIVSTPGKTYNDTTSNWGGAFDYAALGQYVDYLQLMTYDEHYFGGTPGPIASYGYVNKAVSYAVSLVPKEKILMGLAAYGYDWYGSNTRTVRYRSVPALLSQYKITPTWDEASKSPYFKYVDANGISHEVWYENAQSISCKMDLVAQYGIAGVAVWRLGFEDQTFWDAVNSKLR